MSPDIFKGTSKLHEAHLEDIFLESLLPQEVEYASQILQFSQI